MRLIVALFFALFVCSTTTPAIAKDPLTPRSLFSCSQFTSNDEIGILLESYEDTHPDIARAFIVGESVKKRPMWAMRISADPETESAEPEIRIIGTIHGNECMSAHVVLETIDWLLDGYGDDPFISDLIDGAEIVLVPLVNPDGYSSAMASRGNAHGVDLNRNFGFAWINEGPSSFSEPESQAIRQLSQENSFNLGLSYHTIAQYVNAAWNYTPFHPPDEALFQAMGESYAGDSGYKVTFGWDWYDIYGDVNDWSLGTRGTFDWTIELRKDKNMQWSTHVAGQESFLAYVFTGARGLVTDAKNGEPLEARIHTEPAGAPIFNDPDVGDYHRILLPGTYSLTATAQGYETITIDDVEVRENETVTVDFELQPLPANATRFAFAVNGMTLPHRIGRKYVNEQYLNDTMAWEALGESDWFVYSLSPGGSLTVDMGESSPIRNVEGLDLLVISGTQSDDPATVLVAENQDGPFVEVSSGEGSLEIDIASSGFDEIRFVRIVDTGNGDFNDESAGYDLDAVVDLSRGSEYVPPDGGPPIEEDAGNKNDAGTVDPSQDTQTAGCGCWTTGNSERLSGLLMSLLLLIG
jgi:zinc carboxypeptidase/carboxypeptidase family protein